MCFSCGNIQNSKEEQKLKLEREEELRLEKGQDELPKEDTGWKLEDERKRKSEPKRIAHEEDDLDWIQGNWRYVARGCPKSFGSLFCLCHKKAVSCGKIISYGKSNIKGV